LNFTLKENLDDQVVITRGVEDANCIGRKLEEEYEKWGL
jgi:hypothetical protein